MKCDIFLEYSNNNNEQGLQVNNLNEIRIHQSKNRQFYEKAMGPMQGKVKLHKTRK